MFCTQCGTEVSESSVFCAKCGTRIGADARRSRGWSRRTRRIVFRAILSGWILVILFFCLAYVPVTSNARRHWLGDNDPCGPDRVPIAGTLWEENGKISWDSGGGMVSPQDIRWGVLFLDLFLTSLVAGVVAGVAIRIPVKH